MGNMGATSFQSEAFLKTQDELRDSDRFTLA